MENRRIPNPFRRLTGRARATAMAAAGVLAVTATSASLLTFAPAPADVNVGNRAGIAQMAFTMDNHDRDGAYPKPPADAPKEKSLGYDFQYQPNFYYCGPASTRIALSAQGHTPSQDDVANQLGTTLAGTNSSFEIMRVLNKVIGKDVYQVREISGPGASPRQMDQLQADVVDSISNGRVVVANIVGGATDNAGFWRSFPGGHYVTVVGYSDEGRQVQVADPSGVGPNTYWMSTITMANWMAGRGYSH
ncbi:Peptidase_C39 like family protein [Micromonospora pattaloongensis]|uniref:Peptidase_C39 like family protein n=1 Tax=Micromonospora pattaloongensis TaxID=405436 RepID=A0A1H3SY09_9ACTN|nr:C39 family peptidase [Micromonospora pattaloongensis]SDZ42385.1 Peptidase_C39 like family protein [Micromonospora pattaloongensis]